MAKVKKKVVEYFSFYCPGCKHEHVYTIQPDGISWQFNGNMESPTFTPSLLNRGMQKNTTTGIYDIETDRCHLFVTDGKIIYCNDCHHELAGKTVELPEIKI